MDSKAAGGGSALGQALTQVEGQALTQVEGQALTMFAGKSSNTAITSHQTHGGMHGHCETCCEAPFPNRPAVKPLTLTGLL